MRIWISVTTLVLAVALGVSPAAARPMDADDRSENIHLLGNAELVGATDVQVTKDGYAVVAVNGSSESAGLWVVDARDPSDPQPVGHLPCAGSGYDLGLYRNIAVMSIDSASGNSSAEDVGCNLDGSVGKEGIRLVDISDRRAPREVGFVETQCGSHTNITFARKGRVLVYVQSYPASTSGACPSAHGIISVVDITDPSAAEIVSTPSVTPAVGCHDGTVRANLAFMACLTEGQIWDVSDPVNPVVTTHIRDVPDAIWHSSAMSNDGDTAIFGFESFGPGNLSCLGAGGTGGLGGALWFYDVSDPAAPVQLGHFAPPRMIEGLCTSHNFSVVPKHDVLVTAWYAGGVMAVDFTDPTAPTEFAHYLSETGTSTWDANWQRGYAFVGDGTRGLDIYKIDGLSPEFP
ncbi:MAG TPA: hypothetical protein VNC78_09725 [Actinomycetota bacterium]|nr:hypothetical protein [Actinomycetota bacterium]